MLNIYGAKEKLYNEPATLYSLYHYIDVVWPLNFNHTRDVPYVSSLVVWNDANFLSWFPRNSRGHVYG